MGRRSFISMSTINRLISLSNRMKRENERIKLINSQCGDEKERPATYEFSNMDFDLKTRIARLEFTKIQEYRTIQKYVTQDYVRYPIYSDWKVKTKLIKVTIKLTNSELEKLNKHENELIKLFSDEIILKINDENLFPSWFIGKYLKEELDQKIALLDDENEKNLTQANELIKKENETIGILNGKIKQYNRVINQANGILEKNNKLLLKIEKSKPNIFKYVFSLGIYAYLISQKRKAKVNNVILISNEKASLLIKQREEKTSEVSYCEKRISDITNEKILKEKNIAAQKLVEFLRYEKKLSQIEPLVDKIKIDSSFVKLKLLGGFAYEKIIGCYIIHNVEKDKYYVGQSKDVIKRIKQHFKGTVPNNQIFAEDYYTSCMDQKEDIFEFKIIPCNTKDELDLMERNLISQYDSWNSGYNGTSGNT